MLHVQPRSWWSQVYRIAEDGVQMTEVNIRWTREAGSFILGANTFEVGREGRLSGDFFVKRRGAGVATARKPSALRRRFVLRAAGRTYELAPRSALSRVFDLKRDGHAVGSVRPEAWWSRRAQAHLPRDLPLEVRVFVIWLVLVMWKRQSNSSSSGGA